MFVGVRALIYGERWYVWGLGWGLRIAYQNQGWGFKIRQTSGESLGFPLQCPQVLTHPGVRKCQLMVQQQCLSASMGDVPGPGFL